MLEVRKSFILIGLIFGLIGSSIYLVVQIYDYRITFSKKDRLNNKYEGLSFRANLLLNEIEYFKNQLTIREVATEKLGMRSPKLKEQILITKERHK
jgi:cell division protein FtsL|tara:strand:- start:51 stop:338 length:288 start_codon:yes stop_codon:yes gene_type:complete